MVPNRSVGERSEDFSVVVQRSSVVVQSEAKDLLSPQLNRRAFLAGAAVLLTAPSLNGQQQEPQGNLFDMNQGAAKTVRRPAKPGATASMTDEERDKVETQIRCQCSCTLDVYICRTTDFSCQVSPEMHRDIISLVQGGYSAQEILDAFVDTYGEKALMSPKKEGFNLAGYLMPFAALIAGAVALVIALRRMQRNPAAVRIATTAASTDATDDEKARLDAAIRRDD